MFTGFDLFFDAERLKSKQHLSETMLICIAEGTAIASLFPLMSETWGMRCATVCLEKSPVRRATNAAAVCTFAHLHFICRKNNFWPCCTESPSFFFFFLNDIMRDDLGLENNFSPPYTHYHQNEHGARLGAISAQEH